MRARNREINIFNMSLLDILTGMLGAFLFLMVGLVPYYAKVMNSSVLSAEEKKKFDELKKLLDKGLKGPLSPEEAEQLRNEMERLQAENDRLQNEKQQIQSELDDTKKNLDQTEDERAFRTSHNERVAIISEWLNDSVDIDVFVMAPDGKVYSPKKEKIFGKDVGVDGSDSHTSGAKSSNEGITVYLYKPGDYLVFYRIPPGADPSVYGKLYGYILYSEAEYSGQSKGIAHCIQSGLGPSNAALAKPGGFYAWVAFRYDPAKHGFTFVPFPSQLPPGIQRPQ
jgi:hypothetical protein